MLKMSGFMGKAVRVYYTTDAGERNFQAIEILNKKSCTIFDERYHDSYSHFKFKILSKNVIEVRYRFVRDSTCFAKDMETTISGIASILRKNLKLTSWYC